MKRLPSAAVATDPGLCWCDRQRNHQCQSGHPRRDERPVRNVCQDLADAKEPIEEHVTEQVDAGIEEREETQHAPILNNRVHAGEATHWRDR